MAGDLKQKHHFEVELTVSHLEELVFDDGVTIETDEFVAHIHPPDYGVMDSENIKILIDRFLRRL